LLQKYFKLSEHGKKIELRRGKGIDVMHALPENEPFDLIFLDADKETQIEVQPSLLVMKFESLAVTINSNEKLLS
jgi:predicted O-methyltransferase YrrM